MSKVLLVDGNSIINRAFYGINDLTNSEGIHTNAIYGFLNIIFKVIESEKPDMIGVAWDLKKPTFRHEMYDEYKAGRKAMPDELAEQVPLMKEVLESMNITNMSKEGIEADDILGIMAKRAQSEGIDAVILSGDRDLLQISDKKIKISIPKTSKGKTEVFSYYPEDVMAEYGLNPTQFIELKAIMGDSSDNYKGIPGVGEKGATELMTTYGSLDGIYEHIDEITKKALKEKLIEHKEEAYFCKKLATILTEGEIDIDVKSLKVSKDEMFTNKSYPIFARLELKSYLNKFKTEDKVLDNVSQQTSIEMDIETVSDVDIDVFANVLKNNKVVGFAIKEGMLGQNYFSISDGKKIYNTVTLFSYTDYVNLIIDFLKRENTVIATFSIKKLCRLLMDVCEKDSLAEILPGVSRDVAKHMFDVSLAEYLCNPLKSDIDVEYVSTVNAGVHAPDMESYLMYKLREIQIEKLRKLEEYELFEDIELPTAIVLSEMEARGIKVTKDKLEALGVELNQRIDELVAKIYELAGEEFNINSPKQLGVVLFEHLGYEGGKKTKSGYSTAVDVLEKIAPQYELVRLILEYRTYAKLQSTYVTGLLNVIGQDGKIHTTFQQSVTATGRLSSTDPNLQNIPIRYEMGRNIRKVFLPSDGCIFMDADYSQIELRILAHMSEDAGLIKAYESDEDIHRATAASVFGVAPSEVTDIMRRNAKAVNFGIVYGISSFGLSQDIDISVSEAKKYIEDYYAKFPGVKAFLDRTKNDAKEKGYSITLYKRRRPIPELKSSNFMQRSFGERVALNAPIQGTAADIMKIGMINVRDALVKENLKSAIVLQVHDELLLDVQRDEEEKVKKILTDEMVNAASLKVKLEVDLHTGEDWFSAK